MKKIFFGLMATVLTATQLTAQTNKFINKLDDYIESVRLQYDVPGMAVAIVKNGQVVHAKGYGFTDTTKKEKVTAETLFFVASNTKLLTGTALAWLDVQKKISLDDKITKYYPKFRLYDSAATQLVTVRDMLTHRLGTKTFQGDFTFFDGNLSRQEIMYRMRLMKPSTPFRQNFGYCNSCYLTAGEIIPAATGIPWEVFVYDSILQPLGMKNTQVLSKNADQFPHIAKPYTTACDGSLQQVPYDEWDNLAPAASIVSNVSEMANWLQCQIDSGKWQGKQLIPWRAIQKTRDVVTILRSRKITDPVSHFMGYGLGAFVQDYDGKTYIHHTGGASGMVSSVGILPEEKLGVVILTNQDNQGLFVSLTEDIIDSYLHPDKTPNKSVEGVADYIATKKKTKDDIAALQKRIHAQPNPRNIKEYEGAYIHPLYGIMTMKPQGNDVLLTFKSHKNLTATLQYMSDGEWLLSYSNPVMGIHAVKFLKDELNDKTIGIKVADFIEYDVYEFKKYYE